MRILVLNQAWFVDEWRASGHEVKSWGSGDQFDLIEHTPLAQIDDIVTKSNFSGPVDLIVYYDNSMPITVLGLERVSVPVLFYSVDSHHHSFWHKYFATLCDYTYIAHKDYLSSFTNEGNQASWLPLWASQHIEPSSEKKYDAVFVGTMDRNLNPQRVEFFEKLSKIAPVQVMRGEFWKIYPYSKIILNQTVKGDLNFRVFESMISGAMLLTEKSGNGLSELFQDGTEIVCYEKNNVEQAAELIKKYLADPKKCAEIGTNGREKILKLHTTEIRANEVLKKLLELKKTDHPYKNFSGVVAYVSSAFRYESISTSHAALCITAACSLIQQGISRKEPLADFVTMYLVLACLEMDRMLPGKTGHHLLNTLQRSYPDNAILRMASIRSFLNRGLVSKAEKLVLEVGLENKKAFEAAEAIMQQIIHLKISRSTIQIGV